jgi:ABC-type antimicrobial peptide transport system permease subunit
MRIIGVVGDVRQRGPELEPMPECYMPYGQHDFNWATLSLVVRTAGDPNALAQTLRRLAHKNNPDVSVKLTTMEAMLSENVATPRFRTILFAVFAGIAVCLAMAGIYGVMAYAVAQRTHEIGIRMALGAQTSDVLRMVIRRGMTLTLIGVALGLAAAFALTRIMQNLLFNVSATDPVTFALVTLLLVGVAVIASYIPARRATKVDPLQALRHD